MTKDNIIRPTAWQDFNDAKPQVQDEPAEQTESAAELKARLLIRIRDILGYLLPGGSTRAGKFVVGDIRGNRGDSLQVELSGPKAGLWKDHATGEGGDIFDLWATCHNLDTKTGFPAVLDGLRDWLDGRSRTRYDAPAPAPAPILTPPPPEPKPNVYFDELGPKTGEWIYRDRDGSEIGRVWRYDPVDPETGEVSKEFRPWDTRTRKMAPPPVRPLYNIPGVLKATEVVLTEGEKCAQTLIEAGICGTTAMQGAKAPVDKTDWSPLAGKRVVIWPDKDKPGWEYAENAARAALQAGAVYVTIILPPGDKPEKWDCADAAAEGIDLESFITSAPRREMRREAVVLDLLDWTADRFTGPAPEQKFLVEGVFPLGVAAIFAAMGDTGKGMMTLDLGLKIACGEPARTVTSPAPEAFGGAVREFGTAVIFTAEDDQGEIHRRLQRLDPEERRRRYGQRLIIVPLPNAGGPIPLVANTKDGPAETDDFKRIQDKLMRLRDLRMVVFDPLASFIHADVNADPAAGAFATGRLAALATETGASVIVPHHMRKPQGGKPITTAEQARDAIRGSSAIVDGVRAAYAVWPASPEYEEQVFKALGEPARRAAVFQGAVVKANGPADRTVRAYLRNDAGLLVDVTARLRADKLSSNGLEDMLLASIAAAAVDGHPFTLSGSSGLHEQKERLPPPLSSLGRNRLQDLAQHLLNARPQRLVKARAKGSTVDKWLDVPTGPFALGVGDFAIGAGNTIDG